MLLSIGVDYSSVCEDDFQIYNVTASEASLGGEIRFYLATWLAMPYGRVDGEIATSIEAPIYRPATRAPRTVRFIG